MAKKEEQQDKVVEEVKEQPVEKTETAIKDSEEVADSKIETSIKQFKKNEIAIIANYILQRI